MKMSDTQEMSDRSEEIYICDECEKTFKGADIILIEKSDNISLCPLSAPIYIHHKSKHYTMHCPHCKMVHLFGFDIK